ncbi:DUF58 domain-containing protein [Natrarchaeobius halalkaliphilus]|uniref:DUF58 domain-containing protein n=1 Tax=Natrarchaeobius halalkaliphilus TaxID=1679091 RepID=A0A3N6MUG5_9EURY|nr:DUF58 domain-containing protein [Natrarchaeobius halalkaliphilus]RQG89042.1 DUF58 domain-containing protein [Natrarchaeobius halalkaliphilus]
MSDVVRRARWQGALVVALLSSLLAVALGIPGLFVLAVVALGFVLVGQLSAEPDVDLCLERRLEESRVPPGRPVTVTLAVTNDGDRVLPDVRLADDPPDSVPVTDGALGFATAIRPGETITHTYELRPPRGEFAFGPATIRVRSLSATTAVTEKREPEGETTFRCETLLDSFPVQDRTIQFVGQTPTDDGGSGIEFFSTRSYRRGDPINRIDWHRFARTGELATIEYREERAVTVVFVVDDRPEVHRGSLDGGPDSYDLTLYAASRGVVGSLEDGNRTGVATLSGDTWIRPAAEDGVRRRWEDTADGQRTIADGGSLAVDLERRLPRRAQVVLCTPLTDRDAVDLAETLRTRDRDVTVVTPDLTTGVASRSVPPGARIAGLVRTNRIDELRSVGVPVVDWNLQDPISVDLARAFRERGENAGRAGGSGGRGAQ